MFFIYMGIYLGIDPLSTCMCKLHFDTVNGSKGSTLLEKSVHFSALSHLLSGFFLSIIDVVNT